MRLGLVHFAAHTIAAATHVSSAQPQRPQVFLHLFICASLLQKLGSGAFISHHREPKPGIVLSSHDGGGEGRFEHLNMDSHEFVHFFLSFLQDFLHFFLSAHPLLHTTWSLAHSSVHSCSFSHGDSVHRSQLTGHRAAAPDPEQNFAFLVGKLPRSPPESPVVPAMQALICTSAAAHVSPGEGLVWGGVIGLVRVGGRVGLG